MATSLFPRHARAALAGSGRDVAVVDLLHRISRVYGVLCVSVPVFGIATGAQLGVLTDPWLVASLALVVLPGQAAIVAAIHAGPAGDVLTRTAARLAMASGIFALTWVVVTVLMIVRPGSTTGV